MSTHYTATIKITKTVNTPATSGYNNTVTAAASHDVIELASVVVREDELAELIGKAYAHIALVAPATQVGIPFGVTA